MDREKVIKGLEYHLKELSVGKTCFECNYCGNNPCEIHLITDVLALLKKHEPKICVVQDDGCPCCPTCGNELYSFPHYQKYCDECGQEVKWK